MKQKIKIEARKFVTELNGQIELLAEEKDLNSYDFMQEVIRVLRGDWKEDTAIKPEEIKKALEATAKEISRITKAQVQQRNAEFERFKREALP